MEFRVEAFEEKIRAVVRECAPEETR